MKKSFLVALGLSAYAVEASILNIQAGGDHDNDVNKFYLNLVKNIQGDQDHHDG